MADQAAINARLQADPRYRQAWQQLQASLATSGRATGAQGGDFGDRPDDTSGQDQARQAFGAQVAQIIRGYGVSNAQDYVVMPGTGQVIYQPDHTLRNSLLLIGAVALGGAAVQYGADKLIGPATATTGTVGTGGAEAGVAGGIGGPSAAAGPSGVGAGGAATETGAGLLPSTTTVPTASSGLPGGSSWASAGGAPSTGSGIRNYLDTASDVANAFGGLSAGRQQGRNAENFNNYNFDRAQQDQYRTQIQANANENDFGLGRARLGLDTSTQANNFALNRVGAGINLSDADLRQQQFSLDAPKARARNSVQGDILANAQDVSLSGLPSTIPNISIQGGLRPSMFSPNTRALGGEMSAQALASQRAGDHFTPLPDLPSYQAPSTGLPDYVQPPKAPGVTPPVQATGLDSFLNTSGGLLSLAGLFAKYFGK